VPLLFSQASFGIKLQGKAGVFDCFPLLIKRYSPTNLNYLIGCFVQPFRTDMRALRYYGAKDIRLEHDIPEPICEAHQVKIRPSFCGICGSDLHLYCTANALPFQDTPHPITGETWPVTLGHEFSGDIVEVGAQVRGDLQVGDRVAVQPTICCKQCVSCKEGFTNCCDSFGFIGIMGWGGGLSDRVCVDAQFVFKLPDTVPSDIGGKRVQECISWKEAC
jgi:threonine dehydrogenase-like Zn-dependent dehydrogenase